MKLLEIVDGTSIRYAYRIAFLANFYREPLMRRMEREFGLIRPEWTILICLNFQDGVNARDICEITEQPRNTISRAVRTLSEKGLISYKTDPGDARRTVLLLTQEGKQMHERIMPMFEEGERRMLACLTASEQQQLDGLLDKLTRAVPNWVAQD